MEPLRTLKHRITQRVNINLREQRFDVRPFLQHLIPHDHFIQFYALCGITPHQPLGFQFTRANLAGSCFTGQCHVSDSLIYKSDIRGDELKCRGARFEAEGVEIELHENETIWIRDSFLIKTLVHSHSHDPEHPEAFVIQNTVALHYANIHGANLDGCFLGPYSTIDLTRLHDCVVGEFSYLQVGGLDHQHVPAGTLRITDGDRFDFHYQHDPELLRHYITFELGGAPQGLLIDFVKQRKDEFQRLFEVVHLPGPRAIPGTASLNRYAVVKPKTHIGQNVLVAQRAYLENAWLGDGANAQENCYIIHSRLEGQNITAHGAKIIQADLDRYVFVGFNAFLQGQPDARLQIGANTIIMPHTIIDVGQELNIPSGQLVWGCIRNAADLAENSVSLTELARVTDSFRRGRLQFKGCGQSFVQGFQHRIERILEANGAWFDGISRNGHAQRSQHISYHIIQPYTDGPLQGLYPTISIAP